MPEGPLGGPRPLVKTRLKYDVILDIPHTVIKEKPKAVDVLDKRINAVQEGLIKNVQKQIGKTILAVSNLAHPNRTRVIDTQMESDSPNNHDRVTWTYVIVGTGIGAGAETRNSAGSIRDLHKVLIEGDNSPIERARAIREFDPGPIKMDSVWVSTD